MTMARQHRRQPQQNFEHSSGRSRPHGNKKRISWLDHGTQSGHPLASQEAVESANADGIALEDEIQLLQDEIRAEVLGVSGRGGLISGVHALHAGQQLQGQDLQSMELKLLEERLWAEVAAGLRQVKLQRTGRFADAGSHDGGPDSKPKTGPAASSSSSESQMRSQEMDEQRELAALKIQSRLRGSIAREAAERERLRWRREKEEERQRAAREAEFERRMEEERAAREAEFERRLEEERQKAAGEKERRLEEERRRNVTGRVREDEERQRTEEERRNERRLEEERRRNAKERARLAEERQRLEDEKRRNATRQEREAESRAEEEVRQMKEEQERMRQEHQWELQLLREREAEKLQHMQKELKRKEREAQEKREVQQVARARERIKEDDFETSAERLEHQIFGGSPGGASISDNSSPYKLRTRSPLLSPSRRYEFHMAGLDSYYVDNSLLKAPTKGLGYRLSKRLENRSQDGALAFWGSIVRGIDENDGWLRIPGGHPSGSDDDRFLPMNAQGVPVLVKVDDDSTRRTSDAVTLVQSWWRGYSTRLDLMARGIGSGASDAAALQDITFSDAEQFQKQLCRNRAVYRPPGVLEESDEASLAAAVAEEKQRVLGMRQRIAHQEQEIARLEQLLVLSQDGNQLDVQCAACDSRVASRQTLNSALATVIEALLVHREPSVILPQVTEALVGTAHLNPQLSELAAYLADVALQAPLPVNTLSNRRFW